MTVVPPTDVCVSTWGTLEMHTAEYAVGRVNAEGSQLERHLLCAFRDRFRGPRQAAKSSSSPERGQSLKRQPVVERPALAPSRRRGPACIPVVHPSSNRLPLWVLPAGFRLGNVVHALQATRQSMRAVDLVPRVCLTLANLNRVVYFVCDTVLWGRSVGLAPGVNREKWRLWAARHYCCSLLLSLLRDLYEVSRQMGQVARDRAVGEKSPSQDPLGYSVADEEMEWLQSFLLLLFHSLRKHPPLLLDTVKNLGDILIPLDQLGIYKSNPGIIGLGGLVSSVAGIVTVAWPHLRLKTP